MRRIALFLLVVLSACSQSYYDDLELFESPGFEVHEQLYVTDNADLPGLLYSKADGQHKMELYGKFNGEGFPSQISSMVIHEVDNDTSVVLKIGADNSIQYAYRTYEGEKENILVKYDTKRDDSTYIQVYYFDWETETGEFILEVPLAANTKKSQAEMLLPSDMAYSSSCLDDLRVCTQDIINEYKQPLDNLGDFGLSTIAASVVVAAGAGIFLSGAALSTALVGTAVTGITGAAMFGVSYIADLATPSLKKSLYVASCNKEDYPTTTYLDSECGQYQTCNEQDLVESGDEISILTYPPEFEDLFGRYISDPFTVTEDMAGCGFLEEGTDEITLVIDRSSIFIDNYHTSPIPITFYDVWSSFNNYYYYDFRFEYSDGDEYFSGYGTLKSGYMIEMSYIGKGGGGCKTNSGLEIIRLYKDH